MSNASLVIASLFSRKNRSVMMAVPAPATTYQNPYRLRSRGFWSIQYPVIIAAGTVRKFRSIAIQVYDSTGIHGPAEEESSAANDPAIAPSRNSIAVREIAG